MKDGSEKFDWQCSQRTKENRCPATVVQHDDNFIEGPSSHSHPAQPGVDVAVEITSQVNALHVFYLSIIFCICTVTYMYYYHVYLNLSMLYLLFQIREIAVENVFQSAGSIVEDVYRKKAAAAVSLPEASRPRPLNLARMANRARQKKRPDEPTDN